MQALAEALALDPSLKDNAQVASALWVLAQNKKSAERAFEILVPAPMAGAARAILHDLTTTSGVKEWVKMERAERTLRGP